MQFIVSPSSCQILSTIILCTYYYHLSQILETMYAFAALVGAVTVFAVVGLGPAIVMAEESITEAAPVVVPLNGADIAWRCCIIISRALLRLFFHLVPSSEQHCLIPGSHSLNHVIRDE